MEYFGAYKGEKFYLLDPVAKRVGLFEDKRFVQFLPISAMPDHFFKCQVFGVVSLGMGYSSVYSGKHSKVINKSAVEIARKERTKDYSDILLFQVDSHQINGYIMIKKI